MADAALWLAIAGVGAFHGLNPASGWGFAAASGLRSRDIGKALLALIPVAIGHSLSVAAVALAVALGASLDRDAMTIVALCLLAVAAAIWWCRRRRGLSHAPAGRAGLALWSFVMSSGHGAGLTLLPALLPLCVAVPSATASPVPAPLLPALVAIGVHTAAMLAVSGVLVAALCLGAGTLTVRRRDR